MVAPLSPSKQALPRVVLGEKSTNAPLSPRKSPTKFTQVHSTTDSGSGTHTASKSPTIFTTNEQHGARKRAFDEIDADANELDQRVNGDVSTKVPKHACDDEETPTEVATSPGAVQESSVAGSQSSGTFAGLESLPSTADKTGATQIHGAPALSFSNSELAVPQGSPSLSEHEADAGDGSLGPNQQSPTPAQLLRLRLKLATFKLATNQTTTPFPSLDASKQPTRASVLSPKLPIPPPKPVLKIQDGPAKTRWSARRRAREERRLGRYSVEAGRRVITALVKPEVPLWVLRQKEERARLELMEEAGVRDDQRHLDQELYQSQPNEQDDDGDEEQRDEHMDTDADSTTSSDSDDDMHDTRLPSPVPAPAAIHDHRQPASPPRDTSDASSESADIIVTPRRARSHSPPSTRGRWRLAAERQLSNKPLGDDDEEEEEDENVEDERRYGPKSSPSKHAPSSVVKAGAAGVLMSLGVVRD